MARRGRGGTRGATGKESDREVNRVYGDDSTSAHSALVSDQEVVPDASETAAVTAAPTLPPLSALFAQDSGDERSPAVVMLAAVLPTTTITSLAVPGVADDTKYDTDVVFHHPVLSSLPVNSSHKPEDGTNVPT